VDEQEAIRLSQSGNEDSFRWLIETHYRKAFRIASRILRDPFPAADVTQEAFIAAWRALGTFRVGQPFEPWIMTIVARRAKRRLITQAAAMSMDSSVVVAIPAAAADPLAAAMANERTNAVVHALAQLSADRQLILALFYGEGQTIPEIAAALQMPVGTVKSEMHRARAKLKGLLRGFDEK
jgi:RNA polymerase sigma-70 factor (ECF subfamily)